MPSIYILQYQFLFSYSVSLSFLLFEELLYRILLNTHFICISENLKLSIEVKRLR